MRPFLVALGYLLDDFAEFQHLGMFNRLHLAQLVFGPAPVEAAMAQVAEVTQGWGYRSQTREDGRYRLPGVLAQALLINRSSRLEDLSTEAFARLRAHPAAASAPHPAGLYALQRVVAELGHCQPPVRLGFNHAPTLAGVARHLGGLPRPLARHLHSDRGRPREHPGQRGQGRAVAGRGASRGDRSGPVDPGDLRGLGRRGGPDGRR